MACCCSSLFAAQMGVMAVLGVVLVSLWWVADIRTKFK